MTTTWIATDTRTFPSVFALARDLLSGETAETPAAKVDITSSLLDAGSVVLTELRMLQPHCRGAEHHAQIIVGIFGLAESFGVCSPAAVGVSGVLVDHLRDPDEARLAHVLASARSSFDDRELAGGAAALLAASTAFLAEAIGEDPAMVYDEIVRHHPTKGASAVRRSFCQRAG